MWFFYSVSNMRGTPVPWKSRHLINIYRWWIFTEGEMKWHTEKSNLRYADDTILMAESEEELKSLSMSVKKESEKAGLKLNVQKLRSWHLVLSLMASRRRQSRSSDKFSFLGLQNHWGWWLQPWNWKTLASWKESYDKLRWHIKK